MGVVGGSVAGAPSEHRLVAGCACSERGPGLCPCGGPHRRSGRTRARSSSPAIRHGEFQSTLAVRSILRGGIETLLGTFSFLPANVLSCGGLPSVRGFRRSLRLLGLRVAIRQPRGVPLSACRAASAPWPQPGWGGGEVAQATVVPPGWGWEG